MTVRPITVVGHPALDRRAKVVKEVTDEIRTLVADMFETNRAAEGAGLAANQVGSKWSIFIVDCADGAGTHVRAHILNPRIEVGPVRPIDEEDDLEGCLSVPGEAFPTARATWARVTGTDLDGNPVVIEAEGGTRARCLQHEYDHLQGRLYLSRLGTEHRVMAQGAVRDRRWAQRGIKSWDPSATRAEVV